MPAYRESEGVPPESELTRQTALLDELVARVPEAIVLLDSDRRILRVNPEFTKIFGYAEMEALGRSIDELLVPDGDCAEPDEYTRRGTREETILNVETVRKGKDGTSIPVSIFGLPVSIAGSQISEYLIYRDITERKCAEQRLRQSEAYLAEAERLSQTGSWAWNPATGENTYGSKECLRVLGFDPAGPIPKFEQFFQRIHPDDQAENRERFERAIRDKADFEFEYRIVHPDKGVRNIRVVGHAVLDGSGDLGEFVGTVIDITERKRAQQAFQQIVDLVPQFIVVLGPDGKCTYANRVAREHTGLPLEVFRSADVIARIVHPEDLKKVRPERQRGLAGSEPFEVDARMLGKDGIYRWFLGRYNPLIEGGRVVRWYVSATEIDSRKQEEERVRKENVRLEERTRIAQELHDTLLQTFMSASLHLGAALYDVAPDSTVKPRLERILQLMNQGVKEGRDAIQGLRASDSDNSDLVLALSRIRQELLEVQPEIDVRVSVAGQPQQFPAEIQDEIYRIGKEALANAFSHSGAKRVELELEYSGRELQMWIRDNGRGIDPQVLEKGRDGHWGLAGMRERAARIGGRLNILSRATAGTEIQLSIPLERSFRHHSSE
jgi:PAS domain S-box-containing protein